MIPVHSEGCYIGAVQITPRSLYKPYWDIYHLHFYSYIAITYYPIIFILRTFSPFAPIFPLKKAAKNRILSFKDGNSNLANLHNLQH